MRRLVLPVMLAAMISVASPGYAFIDYLFGGSHVNDAISNTTLGDLRAWWSGNPAYTFNPWYTPGSSNALGQPDPAAGQSNMPSAAGSSYTGVPMQPHPQQQFQQPQVQFHPPQQGQYGPMQGQPQGYGAMPAPAQQYQQPVRYQVPQQQYQMQPQQYQAAPQQMAPRQYQPQPQYQAPAQYQAPPQSYQQEQSGMPSPYRPVTRSYQYQTDSQ